MSCIVIMGQNLVLNSFKLWVYHYLKSKERREKITERENKEQRMKNIDKRMHKKELTRMKNNEKKEEMKERE